MICDVGDLVRLSYISKNKETGVGVDPSGLTLSYLTPSSLRRTRTYTYGEMIPAGTLVDTLNAAAHSDLFVQLSPVNFPRALTHVSFYLAPSGTVTGSVTPSLYLGYTGETATPHTQLASGTAITAATINAGGAGWYRTALAYTLPAGKGCLLTIQYTGAAGLEVYGSITVPRGFSYYDANLTTFYFGSTALAMAYRLEFDVPASIIRSSAGHYYHDVEVDDAGTWAWQWVASGEGHATSSGTFKARQSVLP